MVIDKIKIDKNDIGTYFIIQAIINKHPWEIQPYKKLIDFTGYKVFILLFHLFTQGKYSDFYTLNHKIANENYS